jgi:spermidine/putrescine transport system permease protein
MAVCLGDLLFLYVPIAVLIVYSFNAAKGILTWQGWSLQWYLRLLEDRGLGVALWNSILIAAVSSMVSVLFGLGAAIAFERLPGPSRVWLDSALVLAVVMPEIVMGIGLLLLFVLIKLPLGLLTVMISHIAFTLPLVVLLLRARLRKLDPQLEEAARDLGATSWQVFRRVTLPLLRPAMLGAGLLAFAVSLDDFVVTYFTAGPGATTLPLLVYSMIKTGLSPEVNALSTLLLVASMALVAVSLMVQRQHGS